MSTGKRIKRFRQQKNWTQEYLANQMGLDRASLSLIENDKRNLSADELHRLVHLFQVPFGAFYEDVDIKVRGWISYKDGDDVCDRDICLVRYRCGRPRLSYFCKLLDSFLDFNDSTPLKVTEYFEVPL